MSPHSPSLALIHQLTKELTDFVPFAQMLEQHVQFVVRHASQRYFRPDELVLAPEDGPVTELLILRRGGIQGEHHAAGMAGAVLEYDAGDCFPVSAALAQRPVKTRYTATGDTFVLALPVAKLQELVAMSPVFADFVNGRVMHFLQLSQQALRQDYAARSLAEQSLERRLGDLCRRKPQTCTAATPLQNALITMHEQRIGSMLILDETSHALIGILTRYDILSRVTLPQVPLTTPISAVMTQPVISLGVNDSAQDAAVLMSQHGIRHVPVIDHRRVVGIVSERDLFALQRSSIKQLSAEIRAARDESALSGCAEQIRQLASDLLGQGVQAKPLTGLVSHLNDLLTQQLVQLHAQSHSVGMSSFCWIALGSEGRSEQTIATDQDNAIILPDDTNPEVAERVLRMAQAVNRSLAVCGFPLCEGQIMAGEVACCLPLGRWQQQFDRWMDHGLPQDLLNASIFFDFRAICGRAALADELRDHLTPRAERHSRFLRLLATSGLSQDIPLNWRGAIDATRRAGTATLDLKLQASALVVSTARVYALAHGIRATSTAQRLRQFGRSAGLAAQEYDSWVTAFEFIQMLRLRVQLELGNTNKAESAASVFGSNPDGLAVDSDQPNRVSIDALNDVDRRMLRESLRVLRQLQQRLRMDHAS